MKLSHPAERIPSVRSFGVFFVGVFECLGLYGVYKNWTATAIYFYLGVGFALLLVTLVAPRLLAPFNSGWYWLGETLGKIVSPIVLGAIFFLLLTPTACIGRLLGRDELKLKKRIVGSYWIQRNPIGPDAISFKNQF